MEGIPPYEDLDRRFGQDETRGVREQVAGALVNKARSLSQLGRSDECKAVTQDTIERFGDMFDGEGLQHIRTLCDDSSTDREPGPP